MEIGRLKGSCDGWEASRRTRGRGEGRKMVSSTLSFTTSSSSPPTLAFPSSPPPRHGSPYSLILSSLVASQSSSLSSNQSSSRSRLSSLPLPPPSSLSLHGPSPSPSIANNSFDWPFRHILANRSNTNLINLLTYIGQSSRNRAREIKLIPPFLLSGTRPSSPSLFHLLNALVTATRHLKMTRWLQEAMRPGREL